MKALIIAVCVGLFAVFTLPHFVPWTTTHALTLGDADVKVFHLVALVLVGLVLKGGK